MKELELTPKEKIQYSGGSRKRRLDELRIEDILLMDDEEYQFLTQSNNSRFSIKSIIAGLGMAAGIVLFTGAILIMLEGTKTTHITGWFDSSDQ